MTLFMSIFMIVSALIGTLVPSTYKSGFFTFAVSALFYIWYHIIFPSTAAAMFLGSGVGRGFRMFIWGLSEGGNVITPTIWHTNHRRSHIAREKEHPSSQAEPVSRTGPARGEKVTHRAWRSLLTASIRPHRGRGHIEHQVQCLAIFQDTQPSSFSRLTPQPFL